MVAESTNKVTYEPFTLEKPLSRKDVFSIVDEERIFQDKMRPSTHHEGNASVPAHLLLMQEYLQRAITSWTNYRGMAVVEALDEIRKVAALAVRCMEQNGAVRRDCTNTEISNSV